MFFIRIVEFESVALYLHKNVQQLDFLPFGAVEHVQILHQQLRVQISLDFAEADVDFRFLLGRESLLHVGLDATQQEGAEHAMKTLDEVVVTEAAVGVEPSVEIVGRGEKIRQQKVEQRPQFVEIVLERGAGEEESVGAPNLPHHFGQLKGFFFFKKLGIKVGQVGIVMLQKSSRPSNFHS